MQLMTFACVYYKYMFCMSIVCMVQVINYSVIVHILVFVVMWLDSSSQFSVLFVT